MSDELLRFIAVSKEYVSGESRLLILDQIDFTLYRGTSVAITGKSGSGKSTFLNLAGGLDRPTSGSVLFMKKSLSSMGDRELSGFRNRHVGFVFQSYILLEDFTALENVCAPALIGGTSMRAVEPLATQLLKRVGLGDRLTHRPQKLSGGERQRVAICRALIHDPELIIADEPTGSLDEGSAASIEDLFFELVQEKHKTLLLVTHDEQIASRCSVVYLLHNRHLEALL